MSIDLNKYIQETMQIDDLQNDNKEFYVFIIDFNQKTQRAYSIMKRNEIIFPLKQVLHQGLQTNEAITHRLQNKHIQVKNITNTNEGKAALIQTKNKEYFFVNVDKASIIYKAGIEKEKRYKFSDTKIFIFTEQSDIKPIIHEQIKIKKLTEPNTTIKNFLLQIAREYNNDLDPIIQKMQTVKDIETGTIGQIIEDLQKVTTLL